MFPMYNPRGMRAIGLKSGTNIVVKYIDFQRDFMSRRLLKGCLGEFL